MTALCMATFLAALDVAVVTTTLPDIAGSLQASQKSCSWVGSAYLLTYASTTLFWAKTSDIFGRNPVLLVANVIFLIGSLICPLSKSVAILIAGRAV
jgi:MFS family permease